MRVPSAPKPMTVPSSPALEVDPTYLAMAAADLYEEEAPEVWGKSSSDEKAA